MYYYFVILIFIFAKVTSEMLAPILEECEEVQKMALSVFDFTYSDDVRFRFERTERIDSGLHCIIGQFEGESCAFLPIYHDYPVASEFIPQYVSAMKEFKKYLALVAPDSSIILYKIDEADFDDIS